MTRARRVLGPGAYLAMFLVAGLVFAMTSGIKPPLSAREMIALRVLVSLVVAQLVVAVAVFARQADQAMRGTGAQFRWAERVVSIVHDFLIDNPHLARNDALRHDLLEAKGLDLWQLHPSFRSALDAIRDGTSWRLGGRCTAGGRYRAVPPSHHSRPDGDTQ